MLSPEELAAWYKQVNVSQQGRSAIDHVRSSEPAAAKLSFQLHGSCIGNPGPGGWACVLRCGDREKELVGSHPETLPTGWS